LTSKNGFKTLQLSLLSTVEVSDNRAVNVEEDDSTVVSPALDGIGVVNVEEDDSTVVSPALDGIGVVNVEEDDSTVVSPALYGIGVVNVEEDDSTVDVSVVEVKKFIRVSVSTAALIIKGT